MQTYEKGNHGGLEWRFCVSGLKFRCVSQAAGVIHGALCPRTLERGAPGATREAASAAANLELAVQTAASACLVFGVLAREAVDRVAALTAATPPLGSVRPG